MEASSKVLSFLFGPASPWTFLLRPLPSLQSSALVIMFTITAPCGYKRKTQMRKPSTWDHPSPPQSQPQSRSTERPGSSPGLHNSVLSGFSRPTLQIHEELYATVCSFSSACLCLLLPSSFVTACNSSQNFYLGREKYHKAHHSLYGPTIHFSKSPSIRYISELRKYKFQKGYAGFYHVLPNTSRRMAEWDGAW